MAVNCVCRSEYPFQKWENFASLNNARFGHRAALFGSTMVISGGTGLVDGSTLINIPAVVAIDNRD